MNKVKQLYNSIAKPLLSIKWIRFILVGGLNFAFAWSVFALLFHLLGLHYAIANLISMAIGVCFNFMTYGHLVFANSDKVLILRFITMYTSFYFLSTAFMFVMKNYLGISPLYSAFIWAVINGVLTFFVSKYFVYNKKLVIRIGKLRL